MFGDHFATEIPEDGQFDAIYHVGTIGCVAEPAGMTRSLIDRLRPGGILVFNAPNAETARALGEVWVPNTSPPDLVTLFEERFWTEQFGDVADARVRVEPTPPGAAQAFWKRRKRGESVLRPGTTPLIGDSAESGSSAIQPRPRQSQVSKLIRRLVRPLISVTVKFGWPRYLPSESGLFVVLTRKSE